MSLLDFLADLKEMVGDTIVSFEVCNAEYGRTNDAYACLTGASGRRYMLGITVSGTKLHPASQVFPPKPRLEDMRKASEFFTDEMVACRAAEDQAAERQRKRDSERQKRDQLERLRRELGESS